MWPSREWVWTGKRSRAWALGVPLLRGLWGGERIIDEVEGDPRQWTPGHHMKTEFQGGESEQLYKMTLIEAPELTMGLVSWRSLGALQEWILWRVEEEAKVWWQTLRERYCLSLCRLLEQNTIMGWLINSRHLFFKVLEARSQSASMFQGSGKALPPDCRCWLFVASSHGREGKRALWGLL